MNIFMEKKTMRKLPFKMRRIKIPALVFIISISFGIHAYGGEKEHLQYAFALVEKTNLSKMFVELAETFMEPYFEHYENPDSDTLAEANPLKKEFNNEVRIGEDELKWMLAGIYARHFTEKELREIVDFFTSPAGNAWLTKRLHIQTESEQLGLEWGKLLTQRVFQNFKIKSND